jgi:phosphatidylinositol-3-phosphatase
MSRTRSISLLGIGLFLTLLALIGIAVAAPLTTTPGANDAAGSGASAAPLPAFHHVYLIVLENLPADVVFGNDEAPYFNGLVKQGAIATDYHSVARPSQPNYVELIAGQTFGIKDDKVHDLDGTMLADQLDAAGLTWSVSAENLPNACFPGETATGGRDGDGTYARKHEPFISFTSVSGDPSRCGAHLHDLTAFDPNEAAFQLIVPNLCHDGHDCPLSTADAWLSEFVPRIAETAAFADGGVLFITADEADRFGTSVPMLALGVGVQAGTRWAAPRNHASWLRTVEDSWGLTCLADSCKAQNLSGLFGTK